MRKNRTKLLEQKQKITNARKKTRNLRRQAKLIENSKNYDSGSKFQSSGKFTKKKRKNIYSSYVFFLRLLVVLAKPAKLLKTQLM